MPISNELNDEYLEFVCPSCSHVMVKKGSWFKVISKFNCDQCGAKIRLGYPAKVALFEQKRQRMNPSAGDTPSGPAERWGQQRIDLLEAPPAYDGEDADEDEDSEPEPRQALHHRETLSAKFDG
ncbi:hypothetical protein [Mesorhizobium caraganae]|uniref:hypothetical protein n=1 Tax=Mesorhizobium caraganae TaxID=483206 RepID=UPI00178264E0|nr:hypothetical protein [Mesorhizobium caraganae]